MVIFKEEKQKKQLRELRLKEEEDLAKILAEKYEIPYLDLSTVSINTDALRLIPEKDAQEARLAAFRLVGKELHIATASPLQEKTTMTIDGLKQQGYKPFLYMASKRSLNRAWERYKEISFAYQTKPGVLEIANEQIALYAENLSNLNDVVHTIKKTLKSKERYDTSLLLELSVAGALATEASDIHIEPQEYNVRMRFRLNGVLEELLPFEYPVYKLLLSRIKLLSGLKLNIKDTAQDGRFSIKFGGTDVEVRTSVIPGGYGESIVLRILNPKTIAIPFGELGISPHLSSILEHEIKKPNGMILNTGPTGSGKTTTLYAILKKIKTPKIKIITIENPIEYHLAGIVQTQTNKKKGYTYLQGLVSALRQDPDVLMVGEIRDKEAAKTAVNAALTGHLMLSTLHTNNAAGTIPRLIDLGINPKIIGSALNIALAQRLMRKLCNTCKIKDKPTTQEKKIIERIVGTIKQDKKLDTSFLWRARSCDECNDTGYRERIGIFEAILMDEMVEKITRENPSEREIKQASAHQGILDMTQDGMLKVLRGITSLEELGRVIDLEA